MNLRRRVLHPAAAFAVAFATCALPVAIASADNPPSGTVPRVPAAAGNDVPADGQGIVESWGLAPAAADANSGNRPNLTYSAAPGAVIKDAVTVFNYGNVSETFNVYATDAFNNAEGKFDILAADKKAVDAGSWVKLDQGVVTVIPGKQVTIPVTITIPADATPGDHIGALVASSPTVGQSPDNKVITLDRRTGTRLYVRVDGKLHPDLHVAAVTTDYHKSANPLGGTAHVTFRLENRGNVRLAGSTTVTISGPFGLLGTKVTLADTDEVLPGQKVTLTADLKNVPALFLDSTTVRVLPTSKSSVGELQVSQAGDSAFAPPILGLVVLLLIVIAVILLRARRRRRGTTTPVQNRTLEREPQFS